MSGKKAVTRFTILLRDKDPRDIQAAEILNRIGFHGKARYIVSAVLHYAGFEDKPDKPGAARVDEKAIEAVVNRLLSERTDITASRDAFHNADEQENTLLSAGEIDFDSALEALGGDGFNAIAGALEMFRGK